MNKLRLLKINNVILFASALTQIFTGMVLAFQETGRLARIAGEVHELNGFLLAVVIVSHLILNGSVIANHYFRKKTD